MFNYTIFDTVKYLMYDKLQTWGFSSPQADLICSGSEAQTFVGSPLMAEALACRSSLHHAFSLGLKSLQVLSDNQTLVPAINTKLIPHEIFGIVSDVKHLSALFLSISFN